MADPQPMGIPSAPRTELETSERDYLAMAEPVWKTVTGVVNRLSEHSARRRSVLAHLLLNMQETHESMRAILRHAEETEKRLNKLTGSYYDMAYLARPQVETVFVGLLILADETTYLPMYHRSGWAHRATASYYEYMALRGTRQGEEWWKKQKDGLARSAAKLGITQAEINATLADLCRTELTPEQSRQRIRLFPVPTAVVKKGLLAKSKHARLAEFLWRDWKFLCAPAHVDIGYVGARAFLRGDDVDLIQEVSREDVLARELIYGTIVPSLLAVLSLSTAIVSDHFMHEHALLRTCSDAWEQWYDGLSLARRLWDDWAREALGILGD